MARKNALSQDFIKYAESVAMDVNANQQDVLGDIFKDTPTGGAAPTVSRRRSSRENRAQLENIMTKSDIINIKTNAIRAHRHHTYKVLDNEEMDDLVASIKEFGIITPLLVRRIDEDGGSYYYELISGHRRKHAAEILGLSTVPCICKDIDDDMSDIFMVDANSQRETILPSERAYSYKLKYEAMLRQGKSTPSMEIEDEEGELIQSIADGEDLSERQVRRYIKLTDLKEELLEMVDEKIFGTTVGYHLSFLKPQDQQTIINVVYEDKIALTIKNVENIRKAARVSLLTEEKVLEIINGVTKGRNPNKPKKPQFNEKTFKEHYPERIAKAPLEERIEFTKNAIKWYSMYLKENSEEEQAEETPTTMG